MTKLREVRRSLHHRTKPLSVYGERLANGRVSLSNEMKDSRCLRSPDPSALRQLTHADVFEFNWRSFRLQANVALTRDGIRSPRHLFTIHPQPHFAVNSTHVVMVPFAKSFTQALPWETART